MSLAGFLFFLLFWRGRQNELALFIHCSAWSPRHAKPCGLFFYACFASLAGIITQRSPSL